MNPLATWPVTSIRCSRIASEAPKPPRSLSVQPVVRCARMRKSNAVRMHPDSPRPAILTRSGDRVRIGEPFEAARNLDARLRLRLARHAIVEAARDDFGHGARRGKHEQGPSPSALSWPRKASGLPATASSQRTRGGPAAPGPGHSTCACSGRSCVRRCRGGGRLSSGGTPPGARASPRRDTAPRRYPARHRRRSCRSRPFSAGGGCRR